MDTSLPQTTPELVLHEERTAVGSDRVAVERVRVRRRITTEVRQVDVTVRREELVLERTAVGGDADGAAGPQDQPLVMVLSEEVPVVEVVTRPYERVSVHVDTVTGQQQVDASLRREEVELLDEGQVGRTAR